ncbi:ABC transporter permease [Streptomyces sp. NBC_01497]|uniref:ABC transporter permease n=1 Tax=Streptomyces sp. NBC_01497 TaxID=2903885 RepID=UPI002E33156B|nr:ABC transporter permease [Streptomyces sp. NBC_01497]
MTLSTAAHAEWIKIRSTRSLVWSLIVVLASTAGVTAQTCATLGTSLKEPGFDPLFSSYSGLNFGQLAASVFAALAVAGEYRSGAIHTSLVAVPRRGMFYSAKLGVVAGLALLVGLITSLASFLAGQAFIRHENGALALGLGDPGALRAVFGCAVYFALVAVFSAGLAALLRSVVGALCVLVPLYLLVPFIFSQTADGPAVADFLPDHAGRQILLQDPTGPGGAWGGTAILAAWSAAAALAGWLALRSRDA